MTTGLTFSSAPAAQFARAKWKWADAAKAFFAETGHVRYTMDFNPSLELEIKDSGNTWNQRVWAAWKRNSWGRLSKFPVDNMPHVDEQDPYPTRQTQAAIAREWGLPIQRFSESTAILFARGYLLFDERGYYPDTQAAPLLSASLRSPRTNPNLISEEKAKGEQKASKNPDIPDSGSPNILLSPNVPPYQSYCFSQYKHDYPAAAAEIETVEAEIERLKAALKEQRARWDRLELKRYSAYKGFESARKRGFPPTQNPARPDSSSGAKNPDSPDSPWFDHPDSPEQKLGASGFDAAPESGLSGVEPHLTTNAVNESDGAPLSSKGEEKPSEPAAASSLLPTPPPPPVSLFSERLEKTLIDAGKGALTVNQIKDVEATVPPDAREDFLRWLPRNISGFQHAGGAAKSGAAQFMRARILAAAKTPVEQNRERETAERIRANEEAQRREIEAVLTDPRATDEDKRIAKIALRIEETGKP